MRIAVLSDIHSNHEALAAALEYIDTVTVDQVVCLGDIVGYGPDPSECIDLLRRRTGLILMGNHDEAVNDPDQLRFFNSVARAAVDWTSEVLTGEERTFLRGLPLSFSIDDILYVHSTPQEPARWEYIFSGFEARLYANAFTERLCFVGHSHIPGVYAMRPDVNSYNPNDRFIINVGSVGQPRDGDPRLSMGILDTVAATYENVRLEYDVARTAAKIVKRRLPRYLADRLLVGR